MIFQVASYRNIIAPPPLPAAARSSKLPASAILPCRRHAQPP